MKQNIIDITIYPVKNQAALIQSNNGFKRVFNRCKSFDAVVKYLNQRIKYSPEVLTILENKFNG